MIRILTRLSTAVQLVGVVALILAVSSVAFARLGVWMVMRARSTSRREPTRSELSAWAVPSVVTCVRTSLFASLSAWHVLRGKTSVSQLLIRGGRT